MLVLAAAYPAHARDARRNLLYWPAEKQSVTVPLKFGGNLLFAKVEINDQPAGWFMVDTGASYIAVDDDVAEKLQLEKTGAAEAIGIGGSQQAAIHRIKVLKVGEVSLRNRNVLAMDFAAWSDVLGIKLAGVLGYDLWNQAPFTIDYQRRELTFHDPDTFKPDAEAHIEKLTFIRKRPHIIGWVNQKHEGLVMLDTGVQASLHVDKGFLQANPALRESVGRADIEAIGVGGSVRMREATMEHFYVLATRFDRLRVGLPLPAQRNPADRNTRDDNTTRNATGVRRHLDGHSVVQAAPLIGKQPQTQIGIMGGRLLKQFRITFDYRNDRLFARHTADDQLRGQDKPSKESDFLGWPALALAANDGDLNAVKSHLDDADTDINATNREGNTALRIACERGDARIIANLLVAKADPNVVNQRGESAVHPVCEYGSAGVLKALIQAGAKVDLKAKNGATPLRLAAQNGHTAVVKLLLEKGAKVDEPDGQGQSPLMAATANGHSETVLVLLAAGADINHRDDQKQTPLMFAAQAGQARVAGVMLTRGADVNAVNRTGLTALKLAKEYGRMDMIALLRKHGAAR